MKPINFLKFLIVLSPLCLFSALLWHYLVPSGERTIVYEMGDTSPIIQRLLPDERVSELRDRRGDKFVALLDEPVYFSVTPPPGQFESIKVQVAFDPDSTPTYEIGALKDVAAQAFDFKPLANNLLEHLDWKRHDLNGGLAVFSKDSQSQAYKTFLTAPPDRAEVATYRATFPTPYRLADYRPLGSTQKFDISLRGPHELLTYVKDEDFSFDIVYTDVNRTYGADDGSIRVLDENGNLMTEVLLHDDGNIYGNQEPSQKTTLQLSGRAWPEGVYRVILSSTSDVIWRSISTSQRYLVIKNRVFIGDDVGQLAVPKATSLFANAQRVTLETQHREGLQTVTIGDRSLVIDQVGAKYAALTPAGINELKSPVGDIKITGEGKYALSEASFFDPDPVPVTAFTDVEATGVQHVLANLAPIKFVGGWRVASADYDIDSLATENGAYKFALSAPGVHDSLGQVTVHAVTVTFEKPRASPAELVSELKHLVKLLLP